jgi:hypothetical protein
MRSESDTGKNRKFVTSSDGLGTPPEVKTVVVFLMVSLNASQSYARPK